MKKFDKPFDDYEIGPERPMGLELNPQISYNFAKLSKNPIYYFNAIQYRGGQLYRSWFGYEHMWDKEFEDSLMLQLDFVLDRFAKRREYYLEDVTVEREFEIRGLPWKRGVKPRLNFSAEWTAAIQPGIRATARINLLEKPNHVDIEFDDGQIFTVRYMLYLNWKKKCLRSLRDERSKQKRTTETASERREVESFDGVSFEDPTQKLPSNVFDMWQRFRRPHSLQKARSKIL